MMKNVGLFVGGMVVGVLGCVAYGKHQQKKIINEILGK